VGSLGVKDKAVVERLLSLAEDKKQEGELRRYCAYSVGSLGVKDKAIRILINLYHTENDKTTLNARIIYSKLWDFSSI
jgi:HEAT repeat protein